MSGDVRSRVPGYALIATANVLAGTTYVAQKVALDGLPAGVVSTIRNVLAIALLAVFLRAIGVTWGKWSRRDWVRIALLGAFAYGAPMYLGIVGVEHSTAANGSILVLMEPVTVLGLSYLLLGERVGRRALFGIALGFAGALAIVLEGAELGDLTAGEHFFGNVLLLVHALLWGCFLPFAKPLMVRGHDGYGLSALALVFSLLVLVPVSIAEVVSAGGVAEVAREEGAVVPALWWTVYLAVFGSFGSTITWILSLRWLPASATAPFSFLQPVSGVLLGVLLLGEALTDGGKVGAVLIFAGVALTMVPRRRGRGAAGSVDGG